MKRYSILLIFVWIFAGSFSLMAQTKVKLGHIDSNKLFSIMPERDAAQKQLDKYMDELEQTLETMQIEFNNKYEDYLAKADSLSDFVRQTREAELQDLQTRIQTFQSNATQNYQQREAELYQPIIDKAKKAIEEVAKENGYTYVFDSGVGVLLYTSTDSEDIFPLVKTKLGLE